MNAFLSRLKLRAVTLMSVSAIAVLLVASAWARGKQAEAGFSLSVADPRPLARALELVEQRYGWLMTYEDPPYEYQNEIQDVTDAVSRSGDPKVRIIIPKGGAFTFTYSPKPDAQAIDPRDLLQKLLEAHAAANNPGSFGLEETGEVFHVVPTAIRKRDGQLAQYRSLLDTAVWLPEANRSVEETIRVIADAVGVVTGAKVVLGAGPVNLLAQSRVQTGSAGEAAKDVLLRALSATGSRLTWQLCYDPGLRIYGLTIRPVLGPTASGQSD